LHDSEESKHSNFANPGFPWAIGVLISIIPEEVRGDAAAVLSKSFVFKGEGSPLVIINPFLLLSFIVHKANNFEGEFVDALLRKISGDETKLEIGRKFFGNNSFECPENNTRLQMRNGKHLS
jgi:hypothetical protein